MVMMMWEFDLRGLPTHHIQEGEGMCAPEARPSPREAKWSKRTGRNENYNEYAAHTVQPKCDAA